MAKERITGSEALMRSLEHQGVKTLFGYPGGAIMPVFDALYDHRDKLNHILVRHEQGAAHAAQGFARVSGEVGVCLVTSGPGATNTITGIADAMIDSTPIVVIAGQVGVGLLGTDAFQEVDLVGITQPISKWSYQIRRAEDVAWAVSRAFYIARSGRPGPVVLDFAKNAQIEMTDYEPVDVDFIRSYDPDPETDMDEINKAVELINASQRPLVLVGQGVELGDAQEELRKFVEKADLPCGCTRGNVLASDSVKTQQYAEVNEYVDAVCKKLLPLLQQFGGAEKIKGMGVGAPNGNYYSGTIEFAPNLPWKGVIPLAAMFEERLGIPTALTNDANAAAIGEMTYGAARGLKDFIMITLGTGVGSGIVINGQLVYGHDGFAGELGHVVVDPAGRQCGCGRKGCLETYCSATGVARTAREFLVARSEPSLLRNIPSEEIQSKDVYDAAVKGDKLALEIFEFTGKVLGTALANFVAFSSPEAIILFGGLAKSGDYIMKPIQKALEENVLNIYKGKTKLLLSQLKDADAAVLGASALGWEVRES